MCIYIHGLKMIKILVPELAIFINAPGIVKGKISSELCNIFILFIELNAFPNKLLTIFVLSSNQAPYICNVITITFFPYCYCLLAVVKMQFPNCGSNKGCFILSFAEMNNYFLLRLVVCHLCL